MPRPKKTSKVVELGFKEPRKLCPFSGDDLKIVPVTAAAAGHLVEKFQVRGTGWVSTKLFDSREEAEWVFSHDHGVPPRMKNPYKRVEVVGERLPPDPSMKDVENGVKDALALGESFAKAASEIMK